MPVKKECFILMPRSQAFVYIETLMPLIVCLNKYGNKNITCIFSKQADFDQFKEISTYFEILKKNSTLYNFEKDSVLGNIQLLFKVIFKALTLDLMIITMGVLSAHKIVSRLMKVLNGKYYVLPAYNTPLPMNYIENYYYKGLNNPEMRIILGKNKNGRFSSYSDRNTMGKVILQSKFDEERSNFHGYKNDKVYTGCIKMYPAWVTEVNSNTYFDNKKLRESDSCIVIIGFKPHKYFYDNLDEYEKILGETIDGIRKFYPSTLIVVKLKALEVRDNNKWIYKFLDTYNDENLIADYSPLPFLAKKAIFAVLNQASTSFFDFMINQVPYIEHAHYGLNFNSVQSEGSFLRNFKATVSTKNVTELEEAILMIKNNNFPIMSEKEIVNRFNYINDTEIFKKL